MWYECLPSMAAMMVGFAIMDIGPGLCHWLSWGTPKMRYCWDEPSDQWTRRDQRIADTVLRMRWAANHHYTIGLDAIPDEDQPETRFQDYRNYKPN